MVLIIRASSISTCDDSLLGNVPVEPVCPFLVFEGQQHLCDILGSISTEATRVRVSFALCVV